MSYRAPFRGPRMRATKSPQQYPYMQYPYQNVGTQLTWRDSAPFQTRAGDAKSLGLGGTLELPVPGGPEPIPVNTGYSGYEAVGDCGCGCKGAGTCKPKAMGGIPLVDDIANAIRPVFGTATTPLVIVGGLAGLYLIYKKMKKRR